MNYVNLNFCLVVVGWLYATVCDDGAVTFTTASGEQSVPDC